MVRITRLTDYGIQLMAALARAGEWWKNARDLSGLTGMPEPTVRKLLKALSRGGLLVSTRGVRGGYRLARAAEAITVAQILTAIEGPLALTECSQAGPSSCERQEVCEVKGNWQQVNQVISGALSRLTLAQMAASAAPGGSDAGAEAGRAAPGDTR